VDTFTERAAGIRLLLFDVDGVLTDGVVYMHVDGSEAKGFHIRDGAAMVWAQRVGLTVGLLSARSSGATTQRAAQLAIRLVVQGVSSKLEAYERILRDGGLQDTAVAYMGDDLLDLPARGLIGGAGRCRPGSPRPCELGQRGRGRTRRGPGIHRDGTPRAESLGRNRP
jgi:3-deoxy-D-manno-octulosonate 8-phosphate phosphatase (KDO 8-P phosphatase)